MRLLVVMIGLIATASIVTAIFKLYNVPIEKKIEIPNSLIEKKQADQFQKLSLKYCVTYGDESAPTKITEFFSLQCQHCIKLFRDDFESIKKNLIDTGKVYFTFHPVPQDLLTIQAIVCLERLSMKDKRLFLEVMFEEAIPSQELMSEVMMTAMNILKQPIPQLQDVDYLKSHPVCEEIYQFLKQEKVQAIPTVEINGVLFPREVPNYQFINSFVTR